MEAQASFAPTMLQRMEQANTGGKLALVSQQVDEVKGMMADNIELLLERGQKLEEMDEKASLSPTYYDILYLPLTMVYLP